MNAVEVRWQRALSLPTSSVLLLVYCRFIIYSVCASVHFVTCFDAVVVLHTLGPSHCCAFLAVFVILDNNQ